VGDSIGILPQNDPQHVQPLLDLLEADGTERIVDPRSGQSLTLAHFLFHKANLRQLTSSFLKHFPDANPELENKNDYLKQHEPYDVLLAYKARRLDLQELCALFNPLLPRFYSVASSPAFHLDEVHLTVAVTVYGMRDQQRYGVASRFLCHLAEVGQTRIPCYVQKAHHFSLPQTDHTPIIMVGPGTGVAPFRGFMQERLARRAKGKNWLIFGERYRQHNYYYQTFWEELVLQGFIQFDSAFSRDQEQKIYVQHRMLERGKELFAWLQEGAHFYVCGDAQRMAKDVDAMLHRIVQEQGAMTPEVAKAYIKMLKIEKRYLTDVY
jgi:sulfite reductase (NADPH) flavoprotein alpha-component